MAEPDHTVLARLSGLPAHLFAVAPGMLPAGAIDDERMQKEIRSAVAGLEAIKRVIACLLDGNDAFRKASIHGEGAQPPSWSIPPFTYASLLATIDYLDECADMLRHELHR